MFRKRLPGHSEAWRPVIVAAANQRSGQRAAEWARLTGGNNLGLSDIRIQIEIRDLIVKLNRRRLRLIAQTEFERETGPNTPVILSVPDEAPVAKISVSAAKLQLRSLRNAEKKIREVDAQLAG